MIYTIKIAHKQNIEQYFYLKNKQTSLLLFKLRKCIVFFVQNRESLLTIK